MIGKIYSPKRHGMIFEIDAGDDEYDVDADETLDRCIECDVELSEHEGEHYCKWHEKEVA